MKRAFILWYKGSFQSVFLSEEGLRNFVKAQTDQEWIDSKEGPFTV